MISTHFNKLNVSFCFFLINLSFVQDIYCVKSIDFYHNHEILYLEKNDVVSSDYLMNDYLFVGNDSYQNNISKEDVLFELLKVKKSILGTLQLSTLEFQEISKIIDLSEEFFKSDINIIQSGLEVVDLYDKKYGALFTKENRTLGGYPTNSKDYVFEDLIRNIMQTILDYSYTEFNIKKYSQIFNHTFFETSSFFPGSVKEPSDSLQVFVIKVNGTHLRQKGTEDNYIQLDARRPTGCYLAPGSIAKVTVPSELVGVGASVLVGAHTWDSGNKSIVKRMDRVSKKYDIIDEVTTIANPLGGGIYINIPFQKDFGIIDVALENVVPALYYGDTFANKTTKEEWDEKRYTSSSKQWTDLVPWTDIETNKMMMQVPTSWVYATSFSEIENTMKDWDLALDAVSEILGRPNQRSKTTLYAQVDLQLKANVFAPGYPQSNDKYNPYTPSNGTSDNILVQSPRNDRSDYAAVFFHEMGHGEKFYKFKGEFESYVNLLWVGILNKKFGVDINTAFVEGFSGYGPPLDIDKSAISWMLAENFRLGKPMSIINSSFQHEMKYQYRANGKYGDMVRLFGWHVIENHHLSLSNSFDNGTLQNKSLINSYPTDFQMLSYSKSSGFDLRPLIHFWGIQPENFNELETSIKNNHLEKSTAVFDQLSFYKSIVPTNNNEFRLNGIEDFGDLSWSTFKPNDFVSQSYRKEFYTRYWGDSNNGVFGYGIVEANATKNEVQNIINLYFPEGRPEKNNNDCFEIEPVLALASSGSNPNNTLDNNPSTIWETKGDDEYLLYDLGDLYELCDVEIDIGSIPIKFDIEISRNNITYLPVFQNLKSSIDISTKGRYSISRKARYIKIIIKENTDGDWIQIKGVKFYNTKKTEDLRIDTDLKSVKNIYFSPNPANNTITFTDIFTLKDTIVCIYNVNGLLVKTSSVNFNSPTIDISDLSLGVYFIKANWTKNNFVEKMIIMK